MSTQYFQKPENALKRANELISNKQPHEALDLLHDVLVSKKFRTWQKSHETIMCKYLDICVDLKKSRDAKDGLHQYRNITLQQAPASLEVVIKHLVNLAESKCEHNRKKSSEVALAASTKVDDLEAVHTPESIMLSTMTKEGDAERTDREVLVPWIKFLWDTFRTVLDILRTNSKLEHLYHKTSKKAFAFCKAYERRVEFRRLCEILRNHLTLLQKVGSSPVNVHNKQLRGWEGWTPEAVELHLTTRFEQLQVASEMQSWNEAFHAIEDIHVLIEINKKQPRAQLMAIYYEKLIQIFWVSENYMFHAYASYRFYNLSVTQNRNLTLEQKKDLASAVLLSTLSIPSVVEEMDMEDKLFEFDVEKESNAKIAHLLNFSANPKRANLLAELVGRGLLEEVLPELKLLHEILEENFDPFGLVKSAKEVIEKLKSHEQLSRYIPCLEKRLVLRLLNQLAAVYRSVKIDFFHDLLGDVTITSKEIEQLVVRSVKGRQLILRVDHMNGCIHFGDIVFETDTMRKQLTDLAFGLKDVVKKISPDSKLQNMEAEKRQKTHYFQSVASRLGNDNIQILNRKQTIEKKKEDLERLQHEKAMEEQKKLQMDEAERKKLEEERMKKAAADRKKAMMDRVKKQVEIQDQLDALKKKYGNDSALGDIEKMDLDQRQKLLKDAQKKEKDKKEEQLRKIKEASKRLDFITRAIREKERPILEARNQAMSKEESAIFDEDWQSKLDELKNAHGDKVALKNKVLHIRGHETAFKEEIAQKQHGEYETMCNNKYCEAEVARLSAKLERARARYGKAQEEEKQRLEAEAEEKRRVEKQKRDEEDRIRSRELQDEARRKRDEYELQRGSQQAEQQNPEEEWNSNSDWRTQRVPQTYDQAPTAENSAANADNASDWRRSGPQRPVGYTQGAERPDGAPSRWGGAADNFRERQGGGGVENKSWERRPTDSAPEDGNRWRSSHQMDRDAPPPREADTMDNWRSSKPRTEIRSRPEDTRPPRAEPDWSRREPQPREQPRENRYGSRDSDAGSWKRSERAPTRDGEDSWKRDPQRRDEGNMGERAPRDGGEESWKRDSYRREEGPPRSQGSSWRSREERPPPRNSDRNSDAPWSRGGMGQERGQERGPSSRWGDRNAGVDRPREPEGGWRRGGGEPSSASGKGFPRRGGGNGREANEDTPNESTDGFTTVTKGRRKF